MPPVLPNNSTSRDGTEIMEKRFGRIPRKSAGCEVDRIHRSRPARNRLAGSIGRDRFHGSGLVSGEIKPRAGPHRNWRRRVVWLPRQTAAITTAQRRQPDRRLPVWVSTREGVDA
jgi:hypothetical protein